MRMADGEKRTRAAHMLYAADRTRAAAIPTPARRAHAPLAGRSARSYGVTPRSRCSAAARKPCAWCALPVRGLLRVTGLLFIRTLFIRPRLGTPSSPFRATPPPPCQPLAHLIPPR